MRELIPWLAQLLGRRVLVMGDLCLDEYIIGRAQRLSREAPVPVLEFQHRFTVPGAAANPALNIQALGGLALMVGVVGDDEAGHQLRAGLAEKGIDVRGVVVDSSRESTVKTRLLAEGSLRFPQQVARIDRQDRRPLGSPITQAVLDRLRATLPEVDALLLSDYKAGVVALQMVEQALLLAGEREILVTVDSQGDLDKFKGVAVVKCNKEEAEQALHQPLEDEESFRRACRRLQERLGAGAVVITRGSDGFSLRDRHGQYLHVPAANRSEVFDVTGAGDTFIATLTLALAAQAPMADAAHLANVAAGLVVRKLGNATTTRQEMEQALLRSLPSEA